MGTQANVNSERKGGGVGNRSGRVFTKFPKLPPELREKIWKEHCGDYEPRVVDLWLKESSTEDNLIYCTHSRAPAILHTSSEARHIGLQHYDLFQHDEDDDDDDENEGIQEVEAAADEDDDENEGIQEVEAAADEDDDENESIEGVEAAADEDDDESEGIQEVEAAADKDDDENEGIQEVEAAARPRIYVCWDKDIILPVPFDYDAG
ncbi:hypothetical protein F5882DRAFT_123013 [Hyaloscypha sp. PMI_1271]|nr:hypothetical protein F5882DRAFT_123013 [Hyaloscypha sp. PMI_1271]